MFLFLQDLRYGINKLYKMMKTNSLSFIVFPVIIVSYLLDRIGHGAYAPIASSEPDMTVSCHTAQAFQKARLVDEPDCPPQIAQIIL